MLAGAAPIPASSGQTVRVRLNRSGNLAVGQHLPGPIGLEQLLGRDHDLLQGGGQALFRIQAADGADALGQLGRVDRHGACLPFGFQGLANRSAGQLQVQEPRCRTGQQAVVGGHRGQGLGPRLLPATG
jgi:hypothetical protein